MKNIWVLSVKTNIQKNPFSSTNITTSFYAFESFEDAKEAMRAVIKKFAFSQNSMFNGKGEIKYLKKYTEGAIEYEYTEYDDELSKEILIIIQRALFKSLSGKDTSLDLENGTYTDALIAVDVDESTIRFYGYDDGPFNGYDPDIQTNIFSMKEEKDYYLYINDMLGQDDDSSELYIDLRKAKVLKRNKV